MAKSQWPVVMDKLSSSGCGHVFTRDWTTCSEYESRSKFDSQTRLEGACIYDCLIEHKNLRFDNELVSSGNHEGISHGLDLDLLIVLY